MKRLLLVFSLLAIANISFSQNWKDLGSWGQFGDSQEMQVAVLDNNKPVVAVKDASGYFQMYIWDNFAWDQQLNPFVEQISNLQLVNHGDTVYIGFSSVSNNYEVHSWIDGIYTQLGDLSTVDIKIEPNSAQLSVNPTTHLPMLSLWRQHQGLGDDNSDVHLWNGTTWNLHGNPGFSDLLQPDIGNIRAASSGDFSYYMTNQFDLGGASVDPNNSKVGQVETGDRAFGLPDVNWFAIDEGAPSTWVHVSGMYLVDNPELIGLACSPNKEPVGASTSWNNLTELIVFRGNGMGAPIFEPPYYAAANITDLDIQMLNSDSALVLYTNTPISTHNTHLIYEDGGTFVEIGAPGVTDVDLSKTQLDISKHTNKPYVLYWDGSVTGVRVYNQAPTLNSSTSVNTVCSNDANVVAINTVQFEDLDNDPINAWATSQNPAIITTANIILTPTSTYNPMSAFSTYSVTVSPELGMSGTAAIDIFCTDGIDTTMQTINVEVFPAPTASFSMTSVEFCENDDNQVLNGLGTPVGGWYDGTAVHNNKFYPGQAGAGMHPVNYIYTDLNGCIDTASTTVTVYNIPSVSFTTTNADCGQMNGGVDATISNGTPPYDLYWSSGATTEDIVGVNASMYYINITDDNDCYVMGAATVSVNGLSVSSSQTDVACFGESTGAVDITVAGTGPFTYSWSNGASSEDINNLVAGQYEVFVSDGAGCQAMESITITQPAEMTAKFGKMEASCGVADGGLTLNLSGGTGPFNYQWFDGSMTAFGPDNANVNSLGTDAYSVQVTDAGGCIVNFSTVLPEDGGPTLGVMNVVDATCANDGSIDLGINSFNDVASILWNNAATTEDISGLGPGYYFVEVIDTIGCKGMLGIEVNPIIPSAVDICVVTVDTVTNTNLVVWEKPVTTTISHWNLYRESSVAGVYMFIDSIPYTNTSEYNDTIAYPNLRSWRYKMTTVNECGVESLPSLSHKTIHIIITPGFPGQYNLKWDVYEGFSYPTYFVERFTTQSGWQEIAQLSSSTSTSYTDIPPSIDGLDYRIAVEPPAICSSSDKAQNYNSSRSNNGSSGINDPFDDSGLEDFNGGPVIFPNPSEGMFQIMFQDFDNYSYVVFDISGKIVRSDQQAASQILLDLSDVAKGIYSIEISNDSETFTQKLIVK